MHLWQVRLREVKSFSEQEGLDMAFESRFFPPSFCSFQPSFSRREEVTLIQHLLYSRCLTCFISSNPCSDSMRQITPIYTEIQEG